MIAFVLSFLSVIVVSRVLTPEEIGVFSVSVAVLGMAHILREFGVGQYLIQAQSVGLQERRAAFTVSILTAWALAALLFFARHPLAVFYGHHGVAEVLALLAFNFLIMPFGTPLLSMMRRDLQFGRIAIGQISGAVAHASVTIGAALMGESYLSMAWGAIASHVVKMAVLNMMRPGEILMLPTLKGVREVFRFGSVSSMGSMTAEVGGAAPDLIFGRTLGFSEVALYSRAVGLQRMLLVHVVGLVKGIHLPMFARSLREGGDAVAIYGKITCYLFAVMAPALGFFAIMAGPMILFLFGDQWLQSVPLATMVSLYTMIIVPYMLCTDSLIAAGKVGMVFKMNLIVESVRVAVLMTSLWLTLEQVVALLIVAVLVEALAAQVALRSAFGLRFGTLVRALAPSLRLLPFSLAGPLAILWGSARFEPDQLTHLIALLVGGFLFAAGWLAGVFYTGHPIGEEVKLICRRARRR